MRQPPPLRLLACVALAGTASGFAPVARRPITSPPLSTATSDDTSTINALGGVSDFEEWFAANSSTGARVDNLRHALFNSMGRGLQFTSTKSSDLNKVAVVPRKLVLNAPYSDEEDSDSGRSSWDTNLSCKLWEECQKGKGSQYYGYCALLTRGANLQSDATDYPSTAPDALRHWTPEQKARLEGCEKGKKLLEVEREQQKEWRQKYEALSAGEKAKLSYDNFAWAMEAVHSRAFRGDFGGEYNGRIAF